MCKRKWRLPRPQPRSRAAARQFSALVALLTITGGLTSARGQAAGVAVHGGSLGLGADLSLSLSRNVSFRVGGNVFPFDINITSSGIEYTLEIPSPTFLAALDLGAGGAFRVSGGVMIAPNDFTLDAKLAEPVDIGGTMYAPNDVGSLLGSFDTRDVAPYVGIGFGTPGRGRAKFFLDLGAAFHGTPQVSAVATGPVASQPQFQQDLEEEIRAIQDDVDGFRVYPVIAVGVLVNLRR